MNIGDNVKLINNVIYSSADDAAAGLNFSDSFYDIDMIYKVMNIVFYKDVVAVAIGDGSEIFGYEPSNNLQVVREKHM